MGQHTALRRAAVVRAAQAGFTLLELLVVIAIIGVLMSYVGPRFFGQVGKSEVKVGQAQIDAFRKALDAYRLDVGQYPATAQGLTALTQKPEGSAKWQGPYLQNSVPPDPWGHAYVYRSPGEQGRDYEVISYGRDGRPGGDAENADLRSWH
ncbi:type II secretion system major pseudopilin GspG [Aquabacterium sp. A7-Y]|uniref:type II secretion system major pseudopilin GspG n=1 Tax=Aquabacterium sp. A7-Y TaxID=1349605 RepID=UPI00223E42D2|nr:type II secretion system major pseudopilin GspG [Aquabacterium sp. A7-Y]MCW7542132.1 type II secretion system major pseudopilin GspG [Aquabacterium sp. A7-Y]